MKHASSVETARSRSAVLGGALAQTARRIGVGPTELGRIIGVSQPTASRLLAGNYALKEGSKEWELAALLVRLYRGLFAIVGDSDQLAKDWLGSANRAFGGKPPIEAIRSVQGLVHACEYVDAHRARV
ncbi:MAG: DUF2384 domain-containing protein [Burkholderiaceae bacterium]|nr:DUF2384 domain-containing protein [Burkholderiaceae bacterium]